MNLMLFLLILLISITSYYLYTRYYNYTIEDVTNIDIHASAQISTPKTLSLTPIKMSKNNQDIDKGKMSELETNLETDKSFELKTLGDSNTEFTELDNLKTGNLYSYEKV